MDRPDAIAELAALLKEAGLQPTLYGRPVDIEAFRDDLRGEFDRVLGDQVVGDGLRPLVTRATSRVVERHLTRADRLALLAAISCDHAAMAECHPGCGHFSCPCGVSWDEGAGR